MISKNILLVDDSALMRRVLRDIIESDERFRVSDMAKNGLEALDLLRRNSYDAVVLDINMPVMNGLELLKELRREKIRAKVLIASTDSREGAKITLDALELGALDFVHKPSNAANCRTDLFRHDLLRLLEVVASSRPPVISEEESISKKHADIRVAIEASQKVSSGRKGRKVVAIASSTGGPKALQSVIPRLPADLDAPVLLVQHMPPGFTASLAERLDGMSELTVREAQEGDVLQNGTVYVAMGGKHMNVKTSYDGKCAIHYSDEPNREGVKPCANYLYESLAGSNFDRIICVVMTGMGMDGTEGIRNLAADKEVYVIAQDKDSCVVYGMPKSVVSAGVTDLVVPLEQIAQEIILNAGIKG